MQRHSHRRWGADISSWSRIPWTTVYALCSRNTFSHESWPTASPSDRPDLPLLRENQPDALFLGHALACLVSFPFLITGNRQRLKRFKWSFSYLQVLASWFLQHLHEKETKILLDRRSALGVTLYRDRGKARETETERLRESEAEGERESERASESAHLKSTGKPETLKFSPGL